MKYYFHLQFRRFRRIIQDTGVPLFVLPLVIAVVYYFAYHAAKEFNYSDYALLAICIIMLERTNQKERIEFLRNLFLDKKNYTLVRIFENLIILSPVFFLAILTGILWIIPFVVFFGLIYAFRDQAFSISSNKALPTPFSKNPFEMIRYFRIYFIPNIIAIFLFGMGIISQNTNLCIFGIALIPFFTINHLEYVEPVEILWNYAMKPQKFLYHKIKRITLQTYAFIGPLSAILLICFFSNQMLLLLGAVYLLTLLLIMLFVFMKYSIFPRHISLFEMIIFALTGLFPALVLGLLPYYYNKATKNLYEYL